MNFSNQYNNTPLNFTTTIINIFNFVENRFDCWYLTNIKKEKNDFLKAPTIFNLLLEIEVNDWKHFYP